tara:strand:+ start:277 stop:801 length:525 start_codon:yes stop_codon:yes gene_type:complete
MSKNNLLEITNDIQLFIDKFELKHRLFIRVEIVSNFSKIIDVDTLSKVHEAALSMLHLDFPQYDHIKSFSHRCRKIEVMRYSQAFQYIAWNLGYTKSAVAVLVNRNHATVINNINQAKNYLHTDSPEFCRIYYKLFKLTKYYVGTISTNDDGEDNSKPAISALCNKKQNISTSD